MVDTLLFDLDGTLLHNDLDEFFSVYMPALSARFAKRIAPEEFARQLLASTRTMITNTDPYKTNRQAFCEDFFPALGWDEAEVMPELQRFYDTDFAKLKSVTRQKPAARAVMKEAFKRGFRVIIATNPVFPLRAIEHRLEWAGVGPGEFDYTLVTDYETMHFCKPQVEYYKEIVALLGLNPASCMMVGNDVQEDMVAARIGMKTFLNDEQLLGEADTAGDSLLHFDHRGSLDDFHKLLVDNTTDTWAL